MKKKEAMKILKDFYDESALFSIRTALDTVIPELSESEDERIRKAIIAYISHGQHCGVSNADMITWLEKQGKQLDPDKVIGWLKTKVYDDSTYGMTMIEQFKKDFGI